MLVYQRVSLKLEQVTDINSWIRGSVNEGLGCMNNMGVS